MPIVSLPDPAPPTAQRAFLLIINLHNQLALDRQTQQQALQDATTMAQEVCALYPGIPAQIPERGVALVLDAANVTALQAVYATFLVQALLSNYETAGKFRCFLTTTTCQGNPAEVASLGIEDLEEGGEEADFDVLLPIAALARPSCALLSEDVHKDLVDFAEYVRPFTHPVLADLDPDRSLFLVESLPPPQESLVNSQAELILGFAQRSATQPLIRR